MIPTQQRARIRNWQKARLKGFHIEKSVLSADEKVILEQIDSLKTMLLVHWDKTTYDLLNKPMPLFKCAYCGKRGNVPHQIEKYNYCLKHYKSINQE